MNESKNDIPMMMFAVPAADNILIAIGIISVRHSHLDYVLRMTIKSLADVSIAEALDATKYQGSRQLRGRIRKLARQKLGEGQPLIRLEALLTQCERATTKRNTLIHNVWAKELDGDEYVQTDSHEWDSIPTIDSLERVANEIRDLTQELNNARLDGFLSEALNANTSP